MKYVPYFMHQIWNIKVACYTWDMYTLECSRTPWPSASGYMNILSSVLGVYIFISYICPLYICKIFHMHRICQTQVTSMPLVQLYQTHLTYMPNIQTMSNTSNIYAMCTTLSNTPHIYAKYTDYVKHKWHLCHLYNFIKHTSHICQIYRLCQTQVTSMLHVQLHQTHLTYMPHIHIYVTYGVYSSYKTHTKTEQSEHIIIWTMNLKQVNYL